jgi:hypothetical protein
MSKAVIRLGSRHKTSLYAGFALLWLSGALWLAFHYFFRMEGEFGAEAHPLEAWWLRLHGLMAMAALALAGSLAPNHIRLAWNRRRNHRSGLPMLALTVWLAATGYALYYFSSDDNAAWLPPLHWIAGLALPLLLGLHIRLGRRRAQPRVNQPQYPPQRHIAATSYNPPARIKAS